MHQLLWRQIAPPENVPDVIAGDFSRFVVAASFLKLLSDLGIQIALDHQQRTK
jgi:hypothetical protein